MRTDRSPAASPLVALLLVAASGAAHAAVSADMRIVAGGVETDYTSSAALPHTLASGGTVATLQFSATPACTGLDCHIDGPAVGAYLTSGSASKTAESTLRYSFSITGPAANVPILVFGQYATSSPLELPRGSGGTLATGLVDVRSAANQRLFNFQSICYNYPPESNEQSPEQNCGAGTFSGSFMAAAGSNVNIYMNALASRFFPDAAPAAASAYIDPYFRIDPAWAAAHPGYALVFDDGVGNGVPGAFDPVAAVPEPDTYALFALGALALALRRRRGAR